MADSFEMAEPVPPPPPERARRISRWRRIGVPALAIVLVAGVGLWVAREDLADRVIAGQLAALDLPATYEIESVGPGTQVLRNVVIGAPGRPDMTVERVLVGIEYRLGTPTIGWVKLVRPRIYGQYLGGRLSFGSLDKALFAPKTTAQPFAFPELDVTIEDGRGLMLTDFGKVGLKLDGAGDLRNGFAGTLAAVAPRIASGGCVGDGASLFGKVMIRDERPEIAGPLRLASLACAGGVRAGATNVDLNLRADKGFGGVVGSAALRGRIHNWLGATGH